MEKSTKRWRENVTRQLLTISKKDLQTVLEIEWKTRINVWGPSWSIFHASKKVEILFQLFSFFQFYTVVIWWNYEIHDLTYFLLFASNKYIWFGLSDPFVFQSPINLYIILFRQTDSGFVYISLFGLHSQIPVIFRIHSEWPFLPNHVYLSTSS